MAHNIAVIVGSIRKDAFSLKTAKALAELAPSQLKLEYPNGPRNAEALIVHPQTGEIWLLPNEPGTSNTGIYHAPGGLQPNVLTTLTKVGEFATPQGIPFVSGADLHPMGYGVLVRTFSHLFYYARSGPEEPLEEAFQRAPCVMPVAPMTCCSWPRRT